MNPIYSLKIINKTTGKEQEYIPCSILHHFLEDLVICSTGEVYENSVDTWSVEVCIRQGGVEVVGNPGPFEVIDLKTGQPFSKEVIDELRSSDSEVIEYDLLLRPDGSLFVCYRLDDGSWNPEFDLFPKDRFEVRFNGDTTSN